MRLFLFLGLLLCLNGNTFAQKSDSLIDISSELKVELDSIELLIKENKWGIDTTLFFHFTLKNDSDSIMHVTTNSCPSYNQFEFSFNGKMYFPNSKVYCNMNSIIKHELKPKESVSLRELGIMNKGTLTTRLGETTFKIYFIDHQHVGYQIFPKQDIRQVYYSSFEGEVEIIENKISYLKRKKKSKL